MKGHDQVVALLNDVLTAELTAINTELKQELARMTAPDSLPQDIRRVQTRTFTNFKAGR